MNEMLKIVEARACGGGVLRLSWSDGVTRDVDVRMWLRRHPLLDALNDPAAFEQVEVVNRGGGVGWPNGADFCAQALRLRSDDQEAIPSRMPA